jgi:Asp-tRNA(Asn)/Glu-tRNA(Gln) amidotransferase A subunit family amidase
VLGQSLEECLRRIADSDEEVRAWAVVCPQPNSSPGPLHGVPYGAKDIIETGGLPTEYGSPLYKGRIATEDAAVITALGEKGAVLVGKTHTTAFASFDPAPTRNPRMPGHTPGGSSSGSAAAVAAGMVPFAIGTQTLGSVLRPASYCGVCGFKATFGRIPTAGVLPFAPSLDTVGFFTRTAADMYEFWQRSFGRPAAPRTMRSIRLSELGLGEDWDRLTRAAFLINEYEGSRTYEQRYREFGERLGAKLAALIRRGLGIPEDEYRAATAHVTAMRGRLSAVFSDHDVILSDAATGPAPAGFETTGDPAANAPWTALGVPAICVPRDGSLVGLQITAAWGEDDALAAFAATL